MAEVIDNAFPEEMYDNLLKVFNKPRMIYGWKSNANVDPHGHWNLNLVSKSVNSSNLANVYNEIDQIPKNAWNYLRNKIPDIKDNVLLRCYINGGTYGVESYYHKDSFRQDETTIVIYLTDDWKLDWGGETTLAVDGEIIKSVVPKKNRVFVFDSSMLHCARSVTRICYALRKTMMFKSRKRRTDTFEKLSSFLHSNGATIPNHKNGSLHDHLVRVYQILEDNKFPYEVCIAGGLHSVFGTNAFKQGIFDVKDTTVLEGEFNSKAVSLAKTFSNIERPSTLENPVDNEDRILLRTRSEDLMMVSQEDYDALRAIECANLIDQKVFDKEKYPSLNKFWENAKVRNISQS